MADAPELVRLVNNARVRLPGALDAILRDELFFVMDDFFKGSSAWSEAIEFDANTTDLEYDVLATEGDIFQLLGTYEGTADDVTANTAPEVKAFMPKLGTVTLATKPSAAKTYTAVVAITVGQTTSTGYPVFPSEFLIRYHTGLLDGLLARMMSQPAKPYSSAPMATLHMKRFDRLVSQASVAALHQNKYGAQSWRFPKSFA